LLGILLRYVIIPHLEPCLSPWILSEYRFVVNLFKGLVGVVFTNVFRETDLIKLKKLTDDAYRFDFNEFIAINNLERIVVLDPQARKSLTKLDVELADAVIIGGIMGDNPPRGRTKKLITDRVRTKEVISRNLGKKQLTIAGAAYVLKAIWEGKSLNEIKIMNGLSIDIELNDVKLTIELPYAFPVVNGKPVIPEDYIEIVKGGTVYFESVGRCIDED